MVDMTVFAGGDGTSFELPAIEGAVPFLDDSRIASRPSTGFRIDFGI